MVWALLNLPVGVEDTADSLFGQAAGAVAPVFTPLGFGNWQATGSLATGLVAKEVVISSMSVIYLGGDEKPDPQPVDVAADLRAVVVGFGEAVLESIRVVVSILPGVNLVSDGGAAGDTSLSIALQRNFTPASAAAFLVFVLIYAPCVATIGALKSEFGGRWATFSLVYLTVLAWIAGFITYRLAIWLG